MYLAGPEVFLADGPEVAASMRSICRDAGLQPVSPLDSQPDGTVTSDPGQIFSSNIDRIRGADVVIGNVTHFRGAEPDSGTCFELGVAYALGKKLYIYSEDPTSSVDRVHAFHGPVIASPGKRPTDMDAAFVEDFGLPVNLMVSIPSVYVAGDFRAAVSRVSDDLRH